MAAIRVTVPGNILLLGEYAVTCPGGTGVALAVEPRVAAEAVEGDTALSGIMQRARFCDESGSLLAAIADVCGRPIGWQITVDSTALAGERGKRGLGSSAAVAVAVVALSLRLRDGVEPTAQRVMTTAIEAHREWQSGSGSGYDVATSSLGGLVRIERHPTGELRAARLPGELPPVRVVEGTAPVVTRSALVSFDAWRRERPLRAAAFVARSQRLSAAFVRGGERRRRLVLGAGGRALAMLGTAIGVETEPAALTELLQSLRRSGWRAKASGAGGELAVALPPSRLSDRDARNVGAADVWATPEGIRWES